MQIVNGEIRNIPMIVGTGGLTKGCLCVVSGGKAVKAAAAVSAATLLGIACDDYDADDIAQIALVGEGTEVMAPFITTGTKKTFADTDLGKVYDLSDSLKIAPDDTTGGCALLIGYDNDTLEVRFLVPQASRYL
jgi:hypothetical protein